jgi:hypothetical protein
MFMSISGMRFRSTAARLKVSCLHSHDLSVEKVYPVIKEFLPKRLDSLATKGYDLDDPNTLWYLLGIDAVINLEDINGKFTRVAVNFQDKEAAGYTCLRKMRSPSLTEARKALKIYQYWVFVADLKYFPTDEDWIDILYGEIDKSTFSPRLIIL